MIKIINTCTCIIGSCASGMRKLAMIAECWTPHISIYMYMYLVIEAVYAACVYHYVYIIGDAPIRYLTGIPISR